ncbi:MAG: undecaprenyl-diphosphate phosphatase [Rhodovibrionaceae bacterium]|nr:undecaprenyl-diphosphate phosphatase [Rhodovibrionaceae bacterium]
MPILHILILAIIQGLTEFLPVSSSGHLVLAWEVFDGLQVDQPVQAESDRLVIDIAVHVGTLVAVCLYFWRDLVDMLAGLLRLMAGRRGPGARLAFHIVLATIPLLVVGFLAKDIVTAMLRDVQVIAWATIGFGILLWLGDRMGMTVRRVEHMAAGEAFVIGLAQVLALIPGTSRSGVTMTAARFLGYERIEAARFSLLLAIPAILAAGALAGFDLYSSGNVRLGMDALIAGGLAFVAAIGAIALLMGWVRRASFTPFVIYRLLLGALLLAGIYLWDFGLPPAT